MYIAIAYGCNKNIPAAIAGGNTYEDVKDLIRNEFSEEEIMYFNDTFHRQRVIGDSNSLSDDEKEKLTNEIEEEIEEDFKYSVVKDSNRSFCTGEAVFYLKKDVTLKKFESLGLSYNGCCSWCIAIFDLSIYGSDITYLIKNEISYLIS